ncbi:Cytochrome P450 4c3 [Orchesella cincta]|uniref:Cytochrome P450 4c3 n=1 Tax=Orchesella cincta TaxID=48709 RepID=A0A1D2NGU7_ORCCI|nr:Cytochrome P450 4c3 [Orchesella cincta]
MTIQKGEVEEEEPCGNMIELMYRSGFCDQEILDEVNTMINAGFETTSGAVHFLMFLLALNQEHQLICRQEIDSIFNDPMKCQNGILSCDALSDMKHLERCILETLRIFPLAFSMMRKLDIPLKLDEKTELPAGTTVGVLNFTLHNNPEYFPNPTEFQPDRFLPENCRKRHPYAYMPFSVGPRNCIGMKFAMLESKTMAAHILRNFEVCTSDKIGDVAILPDILMTPERDYNFLLKKRVHSKTHLK